MDIKGILYAQVVNSLIQMMNKIAIFALDTFQFPLRNCLCLYF